MRTQLLATFTTKKDLTFITTRINDVYEIVFDKIYVLQNEDDVNELICTYNVSMDGSVDYNQVPNTISLHRKKHSNTLYTINALNELIKNMNNGVLDKRFPVPWEEYQNSLLLTNDMGLNKIPTKIHSIVDTKKSEKE